MSGLIGGDGTNIDAGILDVQDDTMNPPWWRDRVNRIDVIEIDQLYPRGRLTGVDSDNTECWLEGVWWEPPSWPAYLPGSIGTHTLYAFTGVTRDINGSPLGGCNVFLFHTSDNTLQAQGVSDSVGNYLLYSPFTDNHYIVAYLASLPDLTGATVDTLTGSA